MAEEHRELDAYLDAVLIGGREPANVTVLDHDPGWAPRFRAERARIRRVLGAGAKRIEHVGSTAVPGLAAKPIIDIVVAVNDVDEEAAYVPALESAAYVLRVREDGHRMFRTRARDVHVHVYRDGDGEITNLLLLREWLRDNPDDRQLYERTKRELASRPWPDTNHYAAAKTDVINTIMQRARASEQRPPR